MSGLVALWNLDGQPADRDLVAALASTIAHRGRDHSGIWTDGPVALAVQLLRATPESAGERQPVVDGGGLALAFDGRLDNRDELVAAMPGISSLAPDADLVLAAWRTWGRGAAARLAGDFALVCVDARRRELVLARDGVGCRPLYYWADGRRVVCASEIKAILAHPDVVSKPDLDLLADVLLLPRLPHDGDEGETFFHGVRAVLPGQLVSVTPAQTTCRRFWDFDRHARIRYRSFDEYAEHLRTLLFAAVRRRLRSAAPVSVAVSGGLDSSIVLSVADAIGRGGRTAAALPLWGTDTDDAAIEEARFVHRLDEAREVRVTRVPMGPAGRLDDLLGGAWHSESPLADDGWCALGPLLAEAAGRTRRLVTGLWSDQLLFGTAYLTDLFFEGRWRLIARHLREYPRWFVDADPAYFRQAFARGVAAGVAPAGLRGLVRRLRTSRPAAGSTRAVDRAFAARVRRRRPRTVAPDGGTAHARGVYHVVRARAHRLQIEADEKVAAGYGLEHASPFLDRDVIAFVMAIPGEVLTRDGVPRALLREAMKGVVPDPILGRRWRDEHAARARERREAYLSTGMMFDACRRLGFFADRRTVDGGTLDFVGVELWSRQFFSDRLGAPQQKGSRHGGTDTGDTSRRQAAVLASDAHRAR